MNDKCLDCGMCCLETEMPLSESDIKLIIEHSSCDLTRGEFVVKKNKEYFQLKNVNDHCYFLDETSKACKIYEIRPQGCRFYPIIYDFDKNKCVFDVECPRTEKFHIKETEFKKTCNQIKTFIREELKIIN